MSEVAAGGSPPAVSADGEVGKALAYLLRSTAARPQTEAELAAKLAAREVADDVAAEALAKARDLGAVDDAAFARAWVEDRGRVRGYGQARLRQELRRRQVPDEIAEAALAELADRDEHAAAFELARTRAQRLPADLPPQTAARRVTGYLVRRGYPPGMAEHAARRACALDRDWD